MIVLIVLERAEYSFEFSGGGDAYEGKIKRIGMLLEQQTMRSILDMQRYPIELLYLSISFLPGQSGN